MGLAVPEKVHDKSYATVASTFFVLVGQFWPNLSEEDRHLWIQLAQDVNSYAGHNEILSLILTLKNEFKPKHTEETTTDNIHTVEDVTQWFQQKLASSPMPLNYKKLWDSHKSGDVKSEDPSSFPVSSPQVLQKTQESTEKRPVTATTDAFDLKIQPCSSNERRDADYVGYCSPYDERIRFVFQKLRNVKWFEMVEDDDLSTRNPGQIPVHLWYFKVKDRSQSTSLHYFVKENETVMGQKYQLLNSYVSFFSSDSQTHDNNNNNMNLHFTVAERREQLRQQFFPLDTVPSTTIHTSPVETPLSREQVGVNEHQQTDVKINENHKEQQTDVKMNENHQDQSSSNHDHEEQVNKAVKEVSIHESQNEYILQSPAPTLLTSSSSSSSFPKRYFYKKHNKQRSISSLSWIMIGIVVMLIFVIIIFMGSHHSLSVTFASLIIIFFILLVFQFYKWYSSRKRTVYS